MKVIDQSLISDLSNKALLNERKRENYNIHDDLNDNIHRFFNAMEPGTYVRPHRHDEDDKWELFVIVRGKVLAIEFDDSGQIKSKHTLESSSNIIAIEIPERTWHTLACLEAGTVLFEVKKGPYSPTSDKDFADWAPKEGDVNTQVFLDWFCTGAVGSKPPGNDI